MATTQRRKTSHPCPECSAPVIALVVLVDAMQESQPIEKPIGFICSNRCGWESQELDLFDPK